VGYDPKDPELPDLVPEQLRKALRCLALGETVDNAIQLSVFAMAMQIYEVREVKRGGLWKEFGPEDKLMHLRDKLRRTERIWENYQSNGDDPLLVDVDDALDILNYAAFFIRQVKEYG
jgi:hypothetical protein